MPKCPGRVQEWGEMKRQHYFKTTVLKYWNGLYLFFFASLSFILIRLFFFFAVIEVFFFFGEFTDDFRTLYVVFMY